MSFSFVLDASALVELTIGSAPATDLQRRARTGAGAAPELIDIEAAHVLRRLRRRAADPTVVDVAAQDIRDAPVSRTAHRPLLPRIWELRDVMTAYDAAYIALAEELGVPLLTCDAHLGGAHGHGADVVVYPKS